MPQVFLAPDPINSTQFIPGGNVPASGAKLFHYLAGTSTKTDVYVDNTGVGKWTNPIILDSGGNLGGSNEVWQPAGIPIKYVLAPSNDTDPPASPYWTRDNLSGVGDSTGFTEWTPSGLTPTFVSGTSFTVTGDQTAVLTPGRRLKTTNTSGTIYSTISSSVFGAVTTVTVTNDSGTLDAGLSTISYGLINPKNTSLPLIVSVLNFGAKGDGVTDDTSAITAAFAAIKTAGGGMIYVPSGRYKIFTQIVLDEMPVYRVMGASGSINTVSTQTETGVSSVFVNAVGGTMFVQKGTTVANQPVTSNNSWEHIAFEGYLDNTNNIAFDSQNGYDRTSFWHCAFLGGKYGWTSTGTTGTFDIYFEHTHFFNIVTAGCFLPSTMADPLNMVWRDCICRFSGYFIDAQVGDSFYLENNIVEACTSGGCRFDSVFFLNLKGNHFEQNAVGGAGHFDIEVKATTNSTKVLTMIGDTLTFDLAHGQTKQIHITDALKMAFWGVGSNGSGGSAVTSIDINTPGGREVRGLDSCSLATASAIAGATEYREIVYLNTTYTPSWTSTGTQPALGNGTITGTYTRTGSQVTARIVLTMGSTTTFGTGTYRLSLPSTINASQAFVLGEAHFFDTGIADYIGQAFGQGTLSFVTMNTSTSPAANVTPTVPFTFGNGDIIAVEITYNE